MIRYEGDEKAVARVLGALAEGEVIEHGTARTIAAWFTNGGDTVNYAFVSSGYITPCECEGECECDDDGDVEALMEALTHRVDADALRENEAALSALREYLTNRVLGGDLDKVPGWPDMWVPKHVDYPHQDGALDTCWCYDPADECTCDEDDELDCPEHGH